MFVSQGIVERVSPGRIRVACQRQTGCSSCQAKSSCATSSVASAFPDKMQFIELETEQVFSPGDKVELSYPEPKLIAMAFWVYMVPLISAILGAALGSWLSQLLLVQGEVLSIGLGLAGAGVGLWLARLRSSQIEQQAKVEVQLLTSACCSI